MKQFDEGGLKLNMKSETKMQMMLPAWSGFVGRVLISQVREG